jgi:type II secretory pathway component PulC
MDAADQLRKLHGAGFDIQTFERYPRHIGVAREQCIALLEVTPTGLKLTGTPGWRMGEIMGVLVERGGRQVFQAKEEVIQASPEKLEALRRFRQDLEDLLMSAA